MKLLKYPLQKQGINPDNIEDALYKFDSKEESYVHFDSENWHQLLY
jgi:hypothetical protein